MVQCLFFLRHAQSMYGENFSEKTSKDVYSCLFLEIFFASVLQSNNH